MTNRYAEYLAHRLGGGAENTPTAIARKMGVSTGATYKWDKRFAQEYPEKFASYETNQSRGCRIAGLKRRLDREDAEITSLRLEVAELRDQLAKSQAMRRAEPIPDTVSTVEKGQIGEDLVCYQLRRRGFEIHRPWCVTGGTDWFLVDNNDQMIRIEVKSSYSELSVSARRSFMKNNRWGRRSYNDCKVDFFILVDLQHENLFIVPANDIRDGRRCSLAVDGNMWKYKDAYHLLHESVLGRKNS